MKIDIMKSQCHQHLKVLKGSIFLHLQNFQNVSQEKNKILLIVTSSCSMRGGIAGVSLCAGNFSTEFIRQFFYPWKKSGKLIANFWFKITVNFKQPLWPACHMYILILTLRQIVLVKLPHMSSGFRFPSLLFVLRRTSFLLALLSFPFPLLQPPSKIQLWENLV